MVLDVHGGPWGRDRWGLDPMHQLLANRGYAVLSVNFRGSTGFGKKFLNAGNREWAGKMHDDLLDAVLYLGEQLAEPQLRESVAQRTHAAVNSSAGFVSHAEYRPTASFERRCFGRLIEGPISTVQFRGKYRPPGDGARFRGSQAGENPLYPYLRVVIA